jgi:uncharacterized membrane protein YoaK (UPF0700 family)
LKSVCGKLPQGWFQTACELLLPNRVRSGWPTTRRLVDANGPCQGTFGLGAQAHFPFAALANAKTAAAPRLASQIQHHRHIESRYYLPVSIPMPETAPNIDAVPSVRSLSGMFAIASLFAIVGGFLDAYSYLARGHVFANAQTGNVVLFGVRAAASNWTSAWKTLPPILAYMCGVAVARLLRVRPQKKTFRAILICQALELLVLVVLLLFGRFVSDFYAVPLIAFSAALQNTSFSNIGPWQFNSAMTTSNLRNAVSGWVQLAMGETDPKLRGEAIVGSVISLCFAAGVLLGGICTLRLSACPLLPGVVLAAAGMLLTMRERERVAKPEK